MSEGCNPTPPSSNGGGSPAGKSTSACKTHIIHMHLDADRDGTVDDDFKGLARWQWGTGKKGAIVLCNNDDDGGRKKEDHTDDKVNGGNDKDEIAPIEFRVDGKTSAPSSMKAFLEVSDASKIRIFDGRAAGKKEVIGPTKGARHEFPSLAFTKLEYGMEATVYAGTGFDGFIDITFIVEDSGSECYREKGRVRVAPWIMPNHLETAEKVFVVNDGAFNDRFRKDLKPLVSAAGATLVEFATNDVWMQDCMEFGYANLPNHGFRTVVRAPRNRPLKVFPRTLLDADLGVAEVGTLSPDTTFDSTGNLEVTPPCKSKAGKNFPLGRIYYGPGRPGELLDADFKEFLNKQLVQKPIEIDTSWLIVGHVDEIISFVPAPGAPGFKLLLASPKLAYKILQDNLAKNGGSKLLNGREFTIFDPVAGAQKKKAEVTIKEFLSKGIKDLHLDAKDLKKFNDDKQGKLDIVRAQFQKEIGIDPVKDVIDVPILFMPNHDVNLFADALTAGMVNMLVINKHCIVPKPFGPVVGGTDLYEKELESKLKPLGLTVSFIDDWEEYHVNLGEVHCGTNTLRKFTAAKWWEFEP
jgi:hypothetical protein